MSARLPGVAFLVVASVLLSKALRLERWTVQGPGEGFFPLVLSGVLGLLALMLVFGSAKGRAAAGAHERGCLAWYAVGMLAFALLFNTIGLFIAVFAFMVLMIRFAERRGWRAALVSGVASDVVLYALFARLLGIPMPQGPIENLLRALGLLL